MKVVKNFQVRAETSGLQRLLKLDTAVVQLKGAVEEDSLHI